jgi:large subunit ribosomal protein L15
MSISLSQLPKIVGPRRKRLGRGAGSGVGAKSGRGTTRHQKAREDIPLHFEGGQGRMVKRFPLLRGKGRNNVLRPKPISINIEKLNIFADGDVVDTQTLLEKKLIENKKDKVKILANGKLEKKLTVTVQVTQSARKMIETAGGSVKNI